MVSKVSLYPFISTQDVSNYWKARKVDMNCSIYYKLTTELQSNI